MRILNLLLFLTFSTFCGAQVVSMQPVFATENDTVTLIFDASQGNKALENHGPPDVYAHTGVITDKSSSSADWRYVQGNWGKADAKVKMTYLGKNLYQIKYHIRSFYAVPAGEKVLQLAFVFRNTDGTKVGRNSDGTDIYVPLYESGNFVTFIKPNKEQSIFEINDTLHIDILASKTGLIELFNNDTFLDSVRATSLQHKLVLKQSGNGRLYVKLTTTEGTVYDSFLYAINPSVQQKSWPSNLHDGINIINDSTVILSLYAPNKKYVYVIGDFNNWEANTDYFMHRTPDGNRWWLEIKNLNPNLQYGFQYWVDGQIRIADPYSTLVLDKWNDGYINGATFPNLKAYPAAQTTGIVGVFSTAKSTFNWQADNYIRPSTSNLNIYELHIRDFIAAHNYKTLADTLNYLKKLGITAIELMPVNEFEGNSSWGYNTSFHMALDKYYGNEQDFKKFIDLCHQNNIAVILDVVFNHAFSQNSLCQLYWDQALFQPTAENPWLNPTAKHPFNVGYDFNHESQATQYYMDHILAYWLKEFKIDGFRFDLSKGFTQKNTGNDVGAWGNYDASRIALLKRMQTEIAKTDPNALLILEHFADNSEETELANNGFLLWGNMNHTYNEASMGYSSDFGWSSYKNRGWKSPHLIAYMESHDEERLMYKNLQYGSVNAGYNLKDLNTALKRMELVSTFFFTIPGPKMIWQFGELGYDYSIDFNGRVGEKPIKWDYFANQNRRQLYVIYAELMQLRNHYPTFSTSNFELNVAGAAKTIKLNHDQFDALVIGNFNVKEMNITANFQKTGWWYEYFSGDSIDIKDVNTSFTFVAGEYRLYTSKRVKRPENPFLSAPEARISSQALAYPNPFDQILTLTLSAPFTGDIKITDMFGKTMFNTSIFNASRIDIEALKTQPKGIYFITLSNDRESQSFKVMKQ